MDYSFRERSGDEERCNPTVARNTTKNKSIGRTAFILAIVILPTTLLILLGYIAYFFLGGKRILPGHVVDNNFTTENADSETSSFINNNTTAPQSILPSEAQLTTTTTPTTAKTTIIPTIISTAFTAYEQVPHDANSYTQGLSYGDDGYIYETTGLRGKSKLRKIDPNTFEVIKSVDIDDIYFGEGSTYYTDAEGNGRLIFITFQEQTAFIYDPITLAKLQTLSYTTTPPRNEGWGITYDSIEREFIVSDGTSTLFFLDRDTLQEKRNIVVFRFDGSEQDQLNELELIDGLVCCNIWYQDEIICVNRVTGRSIREYDLSTLYPKEERGYHNIMNGIALGKDHVLITGKKWNRMFKVRFDDWTGLFADK